MIRFVLFSIFFASFELFAQSASDLLMQDNFLGSVSAKQEVSEKSLAMQVGALATLKVQFVPNKSIFIEDQNIVVYRVNQEKKEIQFQAKAVGSTNCSVRDSEGNLKMKIMITVQ